MTLPKVTAAIDGHNVKLGQGWSCNSGPGGDDQARFDIPESEARKHSFEQESEVRFYAGSDEPFWQGRLALDPHFDRGTAHLAAEGYLHALAKEDSPLPFQIRDMSVWEGEGQGEIDIGDLTQDEDVEAEGRLNTLFFRVLKGESYAGGNSNFMAAYIPSHEPLTGFKADIVKNRNNTDLDIRLKHAVAPTSASSTLIADYDLVSGGDTTIDESFAGGNVMLVGLRVNTATGTLANSYAPRLKNVRIQGIASGDTYYVYQVLQYLAGEMGWDDDGVSTSLNLNILPLYWQGTWDECAQYVADLQDGWFRVSGESISGDLWSNSDEFTATYAKGAIPSLTPQTKYGFASCDYKGLNGSVRRVLSAQHSNGLTNVWNFGELTDFQHNGDLAQDVADYAIAHYGEKRYAGSFEVAEALINGRNAPFELKYGNLFTISDHDMGESYTHRVQNVNYSSTGVSVDVGDEPSPTWLIARHALKQARKRDRKRRRK